LVLDEFDLSRLFERVSADLVREDLIQDIREILLDEIHLLDDLRVDLVNVFLDVVVVDFQIIELIEPLV